MNQYELTILLEGKASSAKKKAVSERVNSIVTSLEGKLGTVEDWGEKELSYPIAKNSSSVFLHFPIELSSAGAKQISAKLRSEQDILRYLLIRKDE